MTSRDIAEFVGLRHDNVKRTIEVLSARGLLQHPQIEEVKNHRGQTVIQYQIGKRDSHVIVAQLSPEFTARLVDRWQELEAGFAPHLPERMAQGLRLAADALEATHQLLAIAAPKVEFVDRYVEADGLKGFREVAKLLRANEARFREFLIGEKIMYRLAGTLTAFQNHIVAGRFEVRTGVANGEHAFTTTKFTSKGVGWVAGEWAKHQIRGGEAA